MKVTWHYVDRVPEHRNDASRVLCVRAGESRVKRVDREVAARRPNGWTMDRAKVTCRRCIEWMHA